MKIYIYLDNDDSFSSIQNTFKDFAYNFKKFQMTKTAAQIGKEGHEKTLTVYWGLARGTCYFKFNFAKQ